MIRYVLDTDVLSECIAIRGAVLQSVRPLQAQGLAVTIISVEEQFAGWYTALRRAKTRDEVVRKYANMTTSMRFMTQLNILTFDMPALIRFERLLKQRLSESLTSESLR